MQQIGNARGQGQSRFVHQPEHDPIPLGGGPKQILHGERPPLGFLLEERYFLNVVGKGFVHSFEDVFGPGIGLQTAKKPAATGAWLAHFDAHMAQFPGQAAATFHDPTSHHHRSPHTGTQRQKDKILYPFGGAKPNLSQCRGMGIVDDPNRPTQIVCQPVAKGYIHPSL